jgi:hypothetical protein
MNAIAHKRGTQGRTGQSASRIALISACFLAVLSTAWLIGRELVAPSTPVPADRYRGLVQLAPDHEGRCARFELDNRTGFMWPKGDTPCGDITTALPQRSADGPMGRLNGIADHFKGR